MTFDVATPRLGFNSRVKPNPDILSSSFCGGDDEEFHGLRETFCLPCTAIHETETLAAFLFSLCDAVPTLLFYILYVP